MTRPLLTLMVHRFVVLAAGIAAALALAGCGGGGHALRTTFSAGDRDNAQAALNALQQTNISRQLVKITRLEKRAPAACQVHMSPEHPDTFDVYVFWIPYIGPMPYAWLNMTLTSDTAADRFHLGTAPPPLPGGLLNHAGTTILPKSVDYDTPLSAYGAQQDRKNQALLRTHAQGAFAKPSVGCEVLANGYLRLSASA